MKLDVFGHKNILPINYTNGVKATTDWILLCPGLKIFLCFSESETWQCMLCTNVLDCTEDPPEDKRSNTMSPKDLRIAQRIILELYCQYEQSLPFREVVSREVFIQIYLFILILIYLIINLLIIYIFVLLSTDHRISSSN